jgi:hypothetical protein
MTDSYENEILQDEHLGHIHNAFPTILDGTYSQ